GHDEDAEAERMVERPPGHLLEQIVAVRTRRRRNHVAHVSIEVDDAHGGGTVASQPSLGVGYDGAVAEGQGGRLDSRPQVAHSEPKASEDGPLRGAALAGRGDPPAPDGDRRGTGLERLASLRFTYFAIAAFMALYLLTIDGVERALLQHFRAGVERATRV